MEPFLKRLLAPIYLLYHVILYIMIETEYEEVHKYIVTSVINCIGVIVALFIQFLLQRLGIELNTFVVVVVAYVLVSWAQKEESDDDQLE